MTTPVNNTGRPELHALVEQLRALHATAGAPSTRTLGAAATMSHATVAAALRGERLVSWASLRALVQAMGGDEAAFWPTWEAARTASDQRTYSHDGPAVLRLTVQGEYRAVAFCMNDHFASYVASVLNALVAVATQAEDHP